jgi:hypothetical protein
VLVESPCLALGGGDIDRIGWFGGKANLRSRLEIARAEALPIITTSVRKLRSNILLFVTIVSESHPEIYIQQTFF